MIEKKFTIILHIHRTGGNTLDRIFQRKFGNSLIKRQARKLLNMNKKNSLEESLKSKTLADQYFSSHICYGVHELLPKPSTYIAFVREPVSRVISLYYYSKLNPIAFYHRSAQNKTLEEFALETQLHELDNGQVRIIAGGSKDYFMNRTSYGKCDESLLEIAKNNIEGDFTLVGVTDLFDESLLLLCQAYAWDMPFYFRLNQSSGNKSLISQDTKNKIAEKNYLDTKLYEHCRNRLLKQLGESPKITAESLKEYRKKNALFNKRFGNLYNAYDSSKSLIKQTILHF